LQSIGLVGAAIVLGPLTGCKMPVIPAD
jgi:hypothetical protein